MKTKAVHFDEDGYARIRINPDAEFLSLPNTLVNPDESAVEGVSPEYWALRDGKIVPMTHDQWVSRDAELEAEHAPTRGHIIHHAFEKKVYLPVDHPVAYVPTWVGLLVWAESFALAVDLYIRLLGHL